MRRVSIVIDELFPGTGFTMLQLLLFTTAVYFHGSNSHAIENGKRDCVKVEDNARVGLRPYVLVEFGENE